MAERSVAHETRSSWKIFASYEFLRVGNKDFPKKNSESREIF